jgi:hypothetical protein
MRLTFKPFDGRRKSYRAIIDEISGQHVGSIQSDGVGFAGYGGIDVSLFDGKYSITVNRYEECWGFVKGVEAVLNHLRDYVTVPVPQDVETPKTNAA